MRNGTALSRLPRLMALLGALWLGGIVAMPAAAEGVHTHAVYVVSNGWHASIVLARRDLPAGHVPEAADLPADAAYLEFGWGDKDYYPAQRPSLGAALSAALTPTPAVLHLVGLAVPPQQAYAGAEILSLPLTAEEFARLAAGLDAAFDRPQGGRAAAVAPGLVAGRSFFYPAHGRFHLFNTCNTWVARQLAAAGLAVSPGGIVAVDELMERLRALPRAETRSRKEP